MILTGPRVKQWVESVQRAEYAANATAIGWADSRGIIAGVVYEGFNKANIFCHIAKMKGAKMPAAFIAAFVDYPFNQLGCRRMSAAISEHNEQAISFARKLGARQEGKLPEALPDGGALLIFGLLRKDAAKWLSEPYRRRLEVFDGRSSQRDSWACFGSRKQSRQALSTARA